MQRRVLVLSVLAAASLWVGIQTAAAEPIQITGGHLEMAGFTGTLVLAGDRDFSLSAGVGVVDAFFGPWSQCNAGLACLPGTTINLGANFVGSSLHGATATLDGRTFTNVTSAAAATSAAGSFSGLASAPLLDGETVTIVAPFLFEGSFYPGFPGSLEFLVGQGTVRLSLERVFGGETGLAPRWRYTAAHYEFDPVPEPGTLLLTATGVVWLVRRTARRRGRLTLDA